MGVIVGLSEVQPNCLRVLGCAFDEEVSFALKGERNACFKDLEKQAVKTNRHALKRMQAEGSPSAVNEVARNIAAFLSDSIKAYAASAKFPIGR